MTGRMNSGTDGNGMKWMTRLKAIPTGGTLDFEDNTMIVKNSDTVPTDRRLIIFRNDKSDAGLADLYFQYGRLMEMQQKKPLICC